MQAAITKENLTVYVEGRIDTCNVDDIERELQSLRSAHPEGTFTLDATKLSYISSAGLRMLLKLRRQEESLTIVEAQPDVYAVFEMTGFTELIEVRRALRTISIDGCELIGRGGNGSVYRLDNETIVKVYESAQHTLETIHQSRKVAQRLLQIGIPCAIAFDVVRVGERYGQVFELLDCKTVGATIHENPETAPLWAERAGSLLRQLHTTELPAGTLPDARDFCHQWVEIAKDWLTDEERATLHALYDALPPQNTLVHSDFHSGNLMVQGDEIIIIDTDDVAQGDPIIDMAGLFVTYENVSTDQMAMGIMGMTVEEAERYYDLLLRAYYGTDNEEVLARESFRRKLYGLPKLAYGMAKTSSIPLEIKQQHFPRIIAGMHQLLKAAGVEQ